MRIGYDNPTFCPKLESGRFPFDLTLGFECEVEVNEKADDSIDDILSRFLHEEKFLYAKEDGSLSDGAEINSQPFNWNYFLKNRKLLGFTSFLARNGVEGTRNCGFHVHFNRNFFSKKHMRRMVKLVYDNPSFWERVSQRQGEDNLSEYASLRGIMEKFYDGITLEAAKRIVDERMTEHYDALDLFAGDKTIELRIFQGTTNPNLMRTYLEVALAMALYTKETLFDNISIKDFVEYVYSHPRKFPKAICSNILKGKCKYKWYKYQRMGTPRKRKG